VVFTTAEEDAKRRDFTINGLFMDPLDGDKVIDYVGGQEDLKNRIVRAIGEPNHRFEEDHLRLLRAVRFSARFGFKLDEETARAMEGHAGELTRISPERVGEELRLMLTPTTREDAYNLLVWRGLLPVIMRFLPEKWPEVVDEGSFLAFACMNPEVRRRPISFGLALAAMAVDYRGNVAAMTPDSRGNFRHDSDPRALLTEKEIRVSCQAMRQALKISNEEYDQMAGALSFGHLLGEAEPSVATMKRFLARPSSSDARALMEIFWTNGPVGKRIEWLIRRLAELERTDVAPPPMITGDDLTAAGLRPGPLFKRILDAAYDEQLEGRITSKDQALELAQRLAKGQ
jgi:poly(A) polymerase